MSRIYYIRVPYNIIIYDIIMLGLLYIILLQYFMQTRFIMGRKYNTIIIIKFIHVCKINVVPIRFFSKRQQNKIRLY